MRLARPRLRLRMRTLMIAVAVVGLIFGALAFVDRRREEFRALAQYHGARGISMISRGLDGRPVVTDLRGEPTTEAEIAWHRKRWRIYERAARRPWLPVPADAPQPE